MPKFELKDLVKPLNQADVTDAVKVHAAAIIGMTARDCQLAIPAINQDRTSKTYVETRNAMQTRLHDELSKIGIPADVIPKLEVGIDQFIQSEDQVFQAAHRAA